MGQKIANPDIQSHLLFHGSACDFPSFLIARTSLPFDFKICKVLWLPV
jgi:hypothetical protein